MKMVHSRIARQAAGLGISTMNTWANRGYLDKMATSGGAGTPRRFTLLGAIQLRVMTSITVGTTATAAFANSVALAPTTVNAVVDILQKAKEGDTSPRFLIVTASGASKNTESESFRELTVTSSVAPMLTFMLNSFAVGAAVVVINLTSEVQRVLSYVTDMDGVMLPATDDAVDGGDEETPTAPAVTEE